MSAPGSSSSPDPRPHIDTEALRAAAILVYVRQLDQVRFFAVADRIAEQFMAGQLPVGRGAATDELYEFVKAREERMSDEERRNLYARAFGAPDEAPGGTANWSAWIAAASEARGGRAYREADAAGSDVARDVSARLHGSVFVGAMSLTHHVVRAAGVLGQKPVLEHYGAGDIWAVVARVAKKELGLTADVAAHVARAESGRALLSWLAEHADAIDGSGGKARIGDTARRELDELVARWVATAAPEPEREAEREPEPDDDA